MPITQERIIALVSAARYYEDAIDAICEARRAIFARTRNGQLSAADAWNQIEHIIDGVESSIPPNTRAIVAVEALHYRKSARRNERRRQDRDQIPANSPRTLLLQPAPSVHQLMDRLIPSGTARFEAHRDEQYARKYGPVDEAAIARDDAANEAAKLDMLRRGLDPLNGHPFESPHAHHLALIKAGLFEELARLQSAEDDGYAFGSEATDDDL